MTNVRALALEILCRSERERKFVEDVDLAGVEALSPQDRRFLTQILHGTVRHRLTLDFAIESLGHRRGRLSREILWTLRLGIYQLYFLSRVPAYAVVDESVELAKPFGRKCGGFVNAVLRQAERAKAEAACAEGDPTRELPRPGLPPLVFQKPWFPHPDSDPAQSLSIRYSIPRWLVERWITNYGEKAEAVCAASNESPPLTARVNGVRTTRDRLLARLAEERVRARPGSGVASIVLEEVGSLGVLPSFTEGLFTIQDETSIRVGEVAAPQAGEWWLDLCAAPGGKTTHLAERVDQVVAVDVSLERIERVRESARRLGQANIFCVVADGRWIHFRRRFDGVLVDAPCSNTGVLARRPEARWRLRPQDFGKLRELQMALLRSAAALARPGGWIVYSTCSIEPEENEKVVRASSLGVVEEHPVLPSGAAAGGYVARMKI